MEANNQFLQRYHTDHDYNTIHNNHDNYDNNKDGEMREEGSGVGGSRWNPTKEQIEMLEIMYNDEGIRTPSAEQIQQITARLKVYGHIEAKNVFYWFQNHKARQRQKLKQQRLAAALNNDPDNHNFNHNINHINSFLAHPPPHHNYHPPNYNPGVNGVHNLHPKPILPAPPMMINNLGYPRHHFHPNPNVICSPYYKLPQPITTNMMNNNMGFYPQHSPQYNYSAPAAVKRSSPSTKPGYNTSPMMELPRGGSTLNGYCSPMMMNGPDDMVMMNCMGTRTLDLFPVHPTGILEHKFGENNSSSGGSSSSDTYTNGDDRKHQGFFDLFSSGHASSESD